MRCGLGISGLLMSGRSELAVGDPDICSASCVSVDGGLVDIECCTYIFLCIPRLKNEYHPVMYMFCFGDQLSAIPNINVGFLHPVG